jgi:hypothetical protein
MPTPDDPRGAPVWDNYVVAQVVQASLGLIPEHALAVGVEVTGNEVCLRFQLTQAEEEDLAYIDDIVSEFEALVGDEVLVDRSYEIRSERRISPHDGICWVFLART